MDFIKLLRRLEGYIQAPALALPSTAAAENASHHQLRQINDHLYAVHGPSEKPIVVDMVFFHGLQLQGSQEPYISTWASEDQNLWLNWILEDFCNARIFLVSYDAHTERTGVTGRMDMYATCENILQCLIGEEAQVGQLGCPVVLVGHCIGGLVMKQLCVYADGVAQDSRYGQPRQRFLDSIKGLFFFACPHQGTRLSDRSTNFTKGPLFEDISTLKTEAARQNMDFQKVRRREKYAWKTYGLGESHQTTLVGFRGIIVEEASARVDMDGFYTCDADHFSICQPRSRRSSSFTLLSDFIRNILRAKGAEDINKPTLSDGGSCSRDPEQPERTNSGESKDRPKEEQMNRTAKWPKETRAVQSRQGQPGVVVDDPCVQEHHGARLGKNASLNLRQRRLKVKSAGQHRNPQRDSQHTELRVEDANHSEGSVPTIHNQMPGLDHEINADTERKGPELAPKVEQIPLFHEIHEQLPGLRYAINDCPVLPEAIILGFQNYIVNLGTVVLFINTIVPQMGGDNDDKARVLQTILFVSALNTFSQTFFGSRLPVVMGVSFAYVVPILNIINSPELASIADPHERFKQTMCAIQGALILASSVQIVLGFSGFWGYVTRFLSPIAMAPIVVLTAAVGHQYGFPQVAESMEIGLPTIILTLFFSQYWWHWRIKVGERYFHIFELFPILLTLPIICGYSSYLSLSRAYFHCSAAGNCHTDGADATGSDSWVKFPYPFEFGAPTFDVSNAFGMMCAAVVSTVESTGGFWAAYRLSGATPPPPEVISRGIGWGGIGIFLSGMYGTAAGTTVSIENIGLMGITRVGSRQVIQISAVWMAFFSLYGKYGGIFASIPVPIFGAFVCILLGIVAAVGISSLHFINMNKTRNLFIIGFALYMGFSVPSYSYQYRVSAGYGPAHTKARWFNDIVNVFFSSGAVVALLMASILDNTIRSTQITPKDRGMHWFERFHYFYKDPRNEEFYRLRSPFEILGDWWDD